MKQCTWIRLAKEDIKVKKQACNPYLPSWEYIPDGEPYVFGDRVYVYGSHDYFNGYVFCMGDYVCWSAPVDDLGNRHLPVVHLRHELLEGGVDGMPRLFLTPVEFRLVPHSFPVLSRIFHRARIAPATSCLPALYRYTEQEVR